MAEKLRLQQATRTDLPEAEAPRVAGRSIGRGPSAAQPAQSPVQPVASQHGGHYTPYQHGGMQQGGMKTAGPGGATVFEQVDFGSNAAPSSANSLRVVVIVFGLLFTMGAAVVAGLALLAVGFFAPDIQNAVAAAGGEDPDKEHVVDTGVVKDPELRKLRQKKRAAQKAKIEAEYDPMSEMFGGLGAAPVTVYVEGKGKEDHDGIEVICNQVSFRKRAALVNDRAHIDIVPAARCRLVFQGNVPVKTWVTGGDTVKCTFHPVVCRQI